MNVSCERSRIFQDLHDLERHFKYNLKLLRIRDSEIERCSKTNKDLQETLKSSLSVNAKLQSEIITLEHALNKSEHEKSSQKETYQRMVNNLSETLNEMKHNQDVCIQKHQSEIKRKEMEMEKSYTEMLNKKEIAIRRDVEDTRARLQKEILVVCDMKNQIKMLMDENMDLRNKIRDTNAQYSSEMSFYKSELKTSQSINADAKTNVIHLKKQIENYVKDNRKISAQNDELKANLQEKLINIENLIKANNERECDNYKLNTLLIECQRTNKELDLRIEELNKEKDRMKNELAGMKSSQSRCNLSEEVKYEAMVKQNTILQEIVKSMRKERESIVNRDAVDIRNTEMRIETLESIIEQLKQNFIEKFDDGSKNNKT